MWMSCDEMRTTEVFCFGFFYSDIAKTMNTHLVIICGLLIVINIMLVVILRSSSESFAAECPNPNDSIDKQIRDCEQNVQTCNQQKCMMLRAQKNLDRAGIKPSTAPIKTGAKKKVETKPPPPPQKAQCPNQKDSIQKQLQDCAQNVQTCNQQKCIALRAQASKSKPNPKK
jgi:hypothetical protein